MNRNEIEKQSRFIAALADTITGSMWSDELLQRCNQMRIAINEIEKEANKMHGGDR